MVPVIYTKLLPTRSVKIFQTLVSGNRSGARAFPRICFGAILRRRWSVKLYKKLYSSERCLEKNRSKSWRP